MPREGSLTERLAVAKPSRGSERFLMLRAAEDRNGRYQLRAE